MSTTFADPVLINNTTSAALSVSRAGSNPGLQVDESASSAATGLKVTAAAEGAGLALAVMSSGTNESMALDAKGTGSVTISGSSSGAVVLATGGGNVGIGAASPAAKLDVSGTLAVSGVATHAADLAFSDNRAIRRTTSDGSDNGYLLLAGGGSAGSGRGAYMQFGGNESAIAGAYRVFLGATSGAFVIFKSDETTTLLSAGDDGIVNFPVNTTDGFKAASIYGSTSAAAANVVVSSDGTLRRSTSSARYKRDIRPLEEWRFLLNLKPVEFVSADDGSRHLGLTAEDVAAVEPRLAVFDNDGRPDEVAYSHLTAPIVKAIQDLASQLEAAHRGIEEISARVSRLEAGA